MYTLLTKHGDCIHYSRVLRQSYVYPHLMDFVEDNVRTQVIHTRGQLLFSPLRIVFLYIYVS